MDARPLFKLKNLTHKNNGQASIYYGRVSIFHGWTSLLNGRLSIAIYLVFRRIPAGHRQGPWRDGWHWWGRQSSTVDASWQSSRKSSLTERSGFSGECIDGPANRIAVRGTYCRLKDIRQKTRWWMAGISMKKTACSRTKPVGRRYWKGLSSWKNRKIPVVSPRGMLKTTT